MAQAPYLTGHFLIAMPSMPDPRFSRAVVYLCAHNADGAMGIVINRLFEPLGFNELLKQLNITMSDKGNDIRVHFGGPVEAGRGFVLHSSDYNGEGTLIVDEGISLTATVDILKAIAEGTGPKTCFLALGYAGWAPGQLDAELQANGWLHVKGNPEMLFNPDIEHKWEKVLGVLGVKPAMLSSEAGHA